MKALADRAATKNESPHTRSAPPAQAASTSLSYSCHNNALGDFAATAVVDTDAPATLLAGQSVPITVTYEWLICHGPCALIPGATGPTLQLLPAYAGNVVVARVTASNAGGRDYEYSNATFPIDFSVHDKLVQSLTLDGPQRRIGQLLKHHGYGMPFDAPHPGVVRVTWTRSVVRGGKRRSVLVAGGTELVTGSKVIRMELTPEGERLLKRASRLVITSTARFSVGKRTTAKASERITLIR